MIYRGPGFLADVWFRISPTYLPPPLSHQQVVSLSFFMCRRSSLLTAEGPERVGEEPSRTTAKKPGPLYVIQHSLGPRFSVILFGSNFSCLLQKSHTASSTFLSSFFSYSICAIDAVATVCWFNRQNRMRRIDRFKSIAQIRALPRESVTLKNLFQSTFVCALLIFPCLNCLIFFLKWN